MYQLFIADVEWSKWQWDDQATKAFEKCKERLVNEYVLPHFDPNLHSRNWRWFKLRIMVCHVGNLKATGVKPIEHILIWMSDDMSRHN